MLKQFAVIAASFMASIASAASVPLVNMDPASSPHIAFDEPNIDGTWGWTFYVKSPIVVTHVAWFDEGGDGLSHSHRIGLWKDLSGESDWPFVKTSGSFPGTVVDSQQLLGSFPPVVSEGIVVPSGIEAELVGPWRRVALPAGPLVLSPGGYVLGGVDNPNSTDAIRYQLDPMATNGSGNSLPADSRIQIGAPGSSSTAGFQAPSNFFLVGGLELGPMLFVEPVPEPSSLLVAVVCSAGGWVIGRRS